jgi:hypothetical protein
MRAPGIQSFAFFILGYPGDTRASLERTIDYAIDLDSGLRQLLSGVPYPGTGPLRKGKRDGLARQRRLVTDGVLVLPQMRQRPRRSRRLDAINRRSAASTSARLLSATRPTSSSSASTKWSLAWHVGSRVSFGTPVTDASRRRRNRVALRSRSRT